MRNIPSNTLLVLFIAIMLFAACKKSSVETDYNPNLQAANNQVIAERAYADVFNIFFRVVYDTTLLNTGSNVIFGAQCTYSATDGIEYIINYNVSSGACPDGKYRSGRITATVSDNFQATDAKATLAFSDYTVDGLRLEGENIIIHNGVGEEILRSYMHSIPDATLTFYDSIAQGSFTWSSLKTFTWIGGNDTPYDNDDDVFEITGTASGKALGNIAFSAEIDTALGDYFNCRWIRTGRTYFNTPGLAVDAGYIDYIGDDTCTDLVLYNFNGNPFYDRFWQH